MRTFCLFMGLSINIVVVAIGVYMILPPTLNWMCAALTIGFGLIGLHFIIPQSNKQGK